MKASIPKLAQQIIITPTVNFLDEESFPEQGQFVWRYKIIIQNDSPITVQLLNRHWKIYNDSALVDEVFGPGVVGLQPLILPKNKFEYESFCILDTPAGKMLGNYEMQTVDCESFTIQIPDIDLIAKQKSDIDPLELQKQSENKENLAKPEVIEESQEKPQEKKHAKDKVKKDKNTKKVKPKDLKDEASSDQDQDQDQKKDNNNILYN